MLGNNVDVYIVLLCFNKFGACCNSYLCHELSIRTGERHYLWFLQLPQVAA